MNFGAHKSFILGVLLFIPLGLVMDFVHEFGHAIWGTTVGGRLTYMKIAYFELYPRLAVTPRFCLGYVEVAGLLTEFEHGVFLLGGSLTTNIVSWLLGLILLKTRFGYKARLVTMILGFFGILDLPFYVFLTQIGLQHWIFLGGDSPEPLLGARRIGIPTLAFYLMILFTTLGLVFLYFKPLRKKVSKEIKTLRTSLKLSK